MHPCQGSRCLSMKISKHLCRFICIPSLIALHCTHSLLSCSVLLTALLSCLQYVWLLTDLPTADCWLTVVSADCSAVDWLLTDCWLTVVSADCSAVLTDCWLLTADWYMSDWLTDTCLTADWATDQVSAHCNPGLWCDPFISKLFTSKLLVTMCHVY